MTHQPIEYGAPVFLRPGDPGYLDSATVYVRTGSPSLVVRPRDAADVAAAIRYAVDAGLPLAVRSGGHNGQGWGTTDGGVLIDMRSMSSVEVLDSHTGLVRLGAGAQWGDVAEILGQHDLALSSGDTRTVGVGGLATLGGIGWIVRTSGLTIDSMVSADIVTADGELLHVSADEHPDLFWAIRGGGGNFGVVLHAEYLAQRVGRVHHGVIAYADGDIPALVKGWAEVHRHAPEELNSTLALVRFDSPTRPTGAVGLVAYAGSDKPAADAAFAPLLSLGTVVMSDISEKAYASVLVESAVYPEYRAVSTNTLLRTVDDEAVAALAHWYGSSSAPRMGLLRWMGGAAGRVDPHATAFAHRDVEALFIGRIFGPAGATDEDLTALLEFEALRALGVGAYAGFLGIAGPDDLSLIYPAVTLGRLRDIKRRYDPTNVFRLNFNIDPGA